LEGGNLRVEGGRGVIGGRKVEGGGGNKVNIEIFFI